MSHFVLAGATRNPEIYGTTEAPKLAKDAPKSAQGNAENFKYFVDSLVSRL
jgi:hypothetical protein